MTLNEKIWLVGSKGRIAREIVNILNPLDYQIITTDFLDADISKIDDVMKLAELYEPFAIINCAALTDPTLCEKDPDRAFKTNSLGAKNLAIVSNQHNIKLIHLSTDDVFSGVENTSLKEQDFASPKSVYGKTKLLGEEYIKTFSNKHYIVRSSWVYDLKTINTIVRALKQGKLKLSRDQISSPTSNYELSKFIVSLLGINSYGTYHASSEGTVSRLGFVEEVAKLTDNYHLMENLKIDELKDSLRPKYSILENYLLKMTDLYEFPTWEEDLKNYISRNYKVTI